MKQSKLEMIVGLFVLAGIVAVAYLALKVGTGSFVSGDTYAIRARFVNAGGLNPGSNVVIAGVPVGRVEAIKLDPATFGAIVELRLRNDVKLSTDSIASIKTSGLIGDKYLAIAPGGETELIPAGGLIEETEPAVDLESLISRFAFGTVDSKESKDVKETKEIK